MIKTHNFLFFNKKGTNLNLFHDSTDNILKGNFALNNKSVSTGLIESENYIILEKCWSLQYNKFVYTKPISSVSNQFLEFSTTIDSDEGFFFYNLVQDGANQYFIDKISSFNLNLEYDSSVTDITINSVVYNAIPAITNDPNFYFNITNNYETVNIGFSSEISGSFIGKINTTYNGSTICSINLFIDTVEEDTKLTNLLNTLGFNITNNDFLLFDSTDVNEAEIDYKILNEKRKELLLEFHNIFPFLGSYKALINIIKFFGYESLQIKEYWKNINVNSPNFGKLKPVDISDVMKFSNNIEELADLFPSKLYTKTNKFGLYYQINEESGEYDEDGLPITKDVFKFTMDEILIKLYGLKHKLKKYFLPLNSKIVDIIGEALYYSKIELNYWISSNRIDEFKVNINPDFISKSGNYGFIEDLRPLYWVGTKIGNDLKLDGTSNLRVLEFTLTDSFYDNKLEIIDSVSGVKASIIATYKSTDKSNIIALYNELIKLGTPFNKYHITISGDNKILFVEKYQTNTNLISNVEIGRYSATTPVLSYSYIFNENQPVSNYSNAYLSYFFDREFNISTSLNNASNIPVGYPLFLQNTSFLVTWDDMNITWDSLDNNKVYNHFVLPTDVNFPTSQWNLGEDPYSGPSWDNVGSLDFYEITWKVYNSDLSFSIEYTNTVELANEYFCILPYVGKYTVELIIQEFNGSFSKKVKKDFIEIEQKNPNFTIWKNKNLHSQSWDVLDLTWDEMNSTWDLPYLPNTITDDMLINWYSIDNVEFYQNIINQDVKFGSLYDKDAYNWNNIPNTISWEDSNHLYWDELSPSFTKFYIEDITGSQFGFTITDENNLSTETVSFTRNLDIDDIYIDFIDQIYQLDLVQYPLIHSFIYYVQYINDLGVITKKISAISKEYEKPNRFVLVGDSLTITDTNIKLHGYGAIGDANAYFEIYTTSNIQNSLNETDNAIQINDVIYDIPNTITNLTDLAYDLNNNSVFKNDWAFNLVKAYDGLSLIPIKIIAYKKIYSPNDEIIINYDKVYGTGYGRSITTNFSWNSIDVVYYQTDVKVMSQLYFSYDISLMPGFTNPKWVIKDVKNNEVFSWNNKYMTYTFVEKGEFAVELQLSDTNGNTKLIKKNGIIRVV